MNKCKSSLLVLSISVLLLPSEIKPLSAPAKRTVAKGGALGATAALSYVAYAFWAEKRNQEISKSARWSLVEYLRHNHEKKLESYREFYKLLKKKATNLFHKNNKEKNTKADIIIEVKSSSLKKILDDNLKKIKDESGLNNKK